MEAGREIKLLVTDGKEMEETVTVPGPRGKVRIAVGQPGFRSSVWNIWANSKKNDLYVASRNVAGIQKFSLHASGDWRLQWSNEKQAQRFTATSSRLIDRWPQPKALRGGWTKGLSIWVPAEDVRVVPEDTQKRRGVLWLDPPPAGHMGGIHVVLAETDRGLYQRPVPCRWRRSRL